MLKKKQKTNFTILQQANLEKYNEYKVSSTSIVFLIY